MFRLGKLKSILTLLVLVVGFNFSAEAQDDCFYGYKIYVRDEAGKAVGNALLEVSGLRVPLPRSVKYYVDKDAVYHIAGSTGSTIKGDFLFRVSAEGFETYEQQFKFPVCEFQMYELRLQPKGSSAKALYGRLFILHGKVFDEDKKPLGNTTIEATSADGRVYQTVSNPFGYYEIALPKGIANIRISDSRFPAIVFHDFKIEKNYSVLNVPVCLRCNRI
jgi:Carboxypeptidase regulatory-like domain